MTISYPLRTVALAASIVALVTVVNVSSAEANVKNAPFASLGAAAKPVASVTDAAGDVYILNEGDNTVSKITPAGILTRVFSFLGAGAAPQGMTIDPRGFLYVTCGGTDSVTRISPTGETIKYWSYDGVGSMPRGIAADSAGNVFVANYEISTITKITATGEVIPSFAKLDPDDSTFGLTTDAAGNIYAAEPATDRISKISRTGVVIESFAQLTKDAHPIVVAIDSRGNLYSADAAGAVSKFAADGSLSSANIMSGAGPHKPDNVLLDPFGDVFISDEFTNQITAVDSAGGDGGVVLSMPSPATARAISISGSTVYAANYVTGDIQRVELRPSMAPGGINTAIRCGSAASIDLMADGLEPLFAVSMRSLPPGLSLDARTGRISGLATTLGTYAFDVLTMNHWGGSTAQHEVITITP